MLAGISVEEAVRLGAANLKTYGRLFFPRTVRQTGPDYEDEMDAALEGGHRYVAFKMFRGSMKTTKFRILLSKRVAYGITRTALVISETQSHSVRTLRWLRRQVMYNKEWAGAFGLRVGEKWTDEFIEIYHGVEQTPISIVALGLTGQTRGINLDDFRPDFILVDDPCDDENTKTDEQKKKVNSLIFGALKQSLAPPTEAPLAMMAIAQTPLAPGDVIDVASRDPSFVVRTYGCFNEHGMSRWEARFPTAFLRKEKQDFVRRNQLAIWMREMEVKIISTELASFNKGWLQYWHTLPEYMRVVLAIDPASSESDGADHHATVAVGQYGKKVFLLEYKNATKNDPDKMIADFFELAHTWKPIGVVVEAISFQRVLAWILRKAMEVRRIYIPIFEIKGEKRAKPDRLIQTYQTSGLAPYGNLYVRESHTAFISQFEMFGPTVEMQDDELDAVARAIEYLLGLGPHTLNGEYEVLDDEEDELYGGRRPANAACP